MEEALKHFSSVSKILPNIGNNNLKDLIKQIRACKTAQDERAVIQKESASIRTAFKDENNYTRYQNIEKLLYIHMLGYPAHFGQIECLKLAASTRFSDKRLAYLGTMLLLDENQATLTLVTNCLKNDMNNSNVYIVGLALCALGNIASPEMSRDLSVEVERLISNQNSYIRKKACLTALRIIRKVPELADHFVERTQSLLNERNHGVLLTSITLLEQMCVNSPETTETVRQHVPILCRILKTLVAGGSSPEHDVNGITDPFLQVKILRLLRILGKGSNTASEQMNDVLTQVSTATEASKNVGNAILYEAVLTIMNIESDSSLRVLAINILGRFLQNRDSNIKYVALTTLSKTSQISTMTDATALQRHRSTVLDCLRDPDISIRRRALDLSFYLITPANIRILTRELLSYLEIAENDSKSSIASRICEHAGRYRPNKRWEIDTIIRVLRVAGAYVDQNVINHFVKLVSTGDAAVYHYTTTKLYNLIKGGSDLILVQEGLLQASFWCIGEYGDILTKNSPQGSGFGVDEEESTDSPAAIEAQPSESDICDLLTTTLSGPYATSDVKEYGITCLVKLSSRFTQEPVIKKIMAFVSGLKVNLDMEIQQRAVEYDSIFSLDKYTRVALLEKMPVLEIAVTEESRKGTGFAPAAEEGKMSAKGDAADLLGISVGNEKDVLSMVFGDSRKPKGKENIMDLLGGLDLSGSVPSSSPVMVTTSSSVSIPKQSTGLDLLGDLFGGPPPPLAGTAPTAAVATPTFAPIKCYEKNGLVITLTPFKELSTLTQIKAVFSSGDGKDIANILFQIALPKTLKLMMQPPSGNAVSRTTTVTQLMKIENPTKVAIRMRIKLSYTCSTGAVDEIVECSSFDPKLFE